MKKFSLSFVFALVAMVAMFMTSCDKSEVLEETTLTMEETLRFSKDVVLTDESGLNSITLLLQSDNEELLASYTSERYNLVPMFEAPAYQRLDNNTSAPEVADTDVEDYTQMVLISTKSTDFQEGVVAYQIVKPEAIRIAGDDRACKKNYDVYTSTRDRVDITITSGSNGKVKVKRKNWCCWYDVLDICSGAGSFHNNVGWTGSNQIKLKVSNVLGYTYTFHN